MIQPVVRSRDQAVNTTLQIPVLVKGIVLEVRELSDEILNPMMPAQECQRKYCRDWCI